MRIGIVSDIHGNLEAFRAVHRSMEDEGVDSLIHLGDLVGYNANPLECIHLARKLQCRCVLGNHDLAAIEPQEAEHFNVLAKVAIAYARSCLDMDSIHFLGSLETTFSLFDSALFCHGSPDNLYSYILNAFQAKRVFNFMFKKTPSVTVCFYGHTHIQKVWLKNPQGKVMPLPEAYSSVLLDPDNIYLINPGSVGQPRQGDNRARYLIYDTDRRVVTFKAVPYDIVRAQQKILEAGLPTYLAMRLADGR